MTVLALNSQAIKPKGIIQLILFACRQWAPLSSGSSASVLFVLIEVCVYVLSLLTNITKTVIMPIQYCNQ